MIDREVRAETARLSALVASLIDAERERAGITRTELARRLGVPPSRVTKVLSGTANSTLGTLVRFAAACGFRWEIRAPERT